MKSSGEIRKYWKEMKATTGFRKALTFLIFVVIAALFWFILALNDNIQEDFEVGVNVYNVPDSVTFINVPPEKIHVIVRDKGTNLWRNGVIGNPHVDLNFREFANDGVMRVGRNELNAALKDVFGQSSSFISVSPDSMRLIYTTLPGRRVPIVADVELSAAVGKIIVGRPVLSPANAVIYNTRETLDTIMRVFTQKISRSGLQESATFTVKLKSIPGVRIVPETTSVTINVEPLVRKESSVDIKINNVPEGMDLLLFPSMVKVEYFVPMSHFSSDELPEVSVDFRDLGKASKKLPLHASRSNSEIMNVSVMADSVEYTLVRE